MNPNNDNRPNTTDEERTAEELPAVATEEQPTAAEESAPEGQAQEASAPQISGWERFVAGVKKFGKAAWAYGKCAKIELLVLLGVIVLDLVTKALVSRFVVQEITVIPNFLRITYMENRFAAFGSVLGLEKILSEDAIRVILLIVTLLAMGVFSYILYRCRRRHLLMRLGIALIIGGAFGNFIDRLCLHYVRDFIEIIFFGCDLPWLGTTFPVFNVADMGLTVGVVLFLVYFIAIYKEPKKPTAESATEGKEDGQEDEAAAPKEDAATEPSTQDEATAADTTSEPKDA